MGIIKESSNWSGGIYQIEKDDDVLGGDDGLANKPIKELANRTVFLKDAVEESNKKLGKSILDVGNNVSQAEKEMKIKIEEITQAIESIGSGFRPFLTLEDLNTYSKDDKNEFIAYVTNDKTEPNNGIYAWDGNKWIKSQYDPETTLINYINSVTNASKGAGINRYSKSVSANRKGVGFAVTDSLGQRSWLEFNDEDGGLTLNSQFLIESSLGVAFKQVKHKDFFYALTDMTGVATDLVLDRTGQIADFVIERMALRIGQYLEPSTNFKKMSVWGSSSFAAMHSSFKEMFKHFDLENTYLGGDSGARIDSIGARLGAIETIVTFDDGEIPSSGAAAITLSWPVDRGSNSFSGVLVNGIQGTISYAEAAPNKYIFNRKKAGLPVDVTDIKLSFKPDANHFKNGVVLFNGGKNNLTDSNIEINSAVYVFEKTVEIIKALQPENEAHYLVMGHFINYGQSKSISAPRIKACNKMLKGYFSDYYFDIQEYVTGQQIWTDTGINPTADDLYRQSIGELPQSIARDAGHLNATAYTAVTAKLQQQLINLGWYE